MSEANDAEAVLHLDGSSGIASPLFSVVDYVLFGLSLAVSLAIGVWSAMKSRGKESIQEYMVGSGRLSTTAVGVSIIGGIISAISILGNPTEVYLYGTQITTNMLGLALGGIVLHQVTIPIFYKLKVISYAEYLEVRFKSKALRRLGSLTHILLQFFYMAVTLYAPSLALSTATRLPTWAAITIMGLVCTFYISLGGVKAVVYNDVVQTTLMFIGVLFVVIICCLDIGLANIWTIADQGGRIEFFNFSPSVFERHTFLSTTVLGFYFTIQAMCFSQASIQRFASVGSIDNAKRLVWFYLIGIWLLWGLFFFSGVVAYAVYNDCDPFTSGRIKKADQVLPYLVMDKLSHLPGVPGIFVAAVYGGVLSSLSTSGNCVACLIWRDFLEERPHFSGMSSATATKVVKIISAVAGLTGTLLGLLAGKMGTLFNFVNTLYGALFGPMHGVFLAGMCTPWVNTKSTVFGCLIAVSYNLWVLVASYLWKDPTPYLHLSVDGCPENLVYLTNTSSAFNTSTIIPPLDDSFASQANDSISQNPSIDSSGDWAMYKVSYCYFGITGIIITMVISNIASLLTGAVGPGDVNERCCTPLSRRVHCWLWRRKVNPELTTEEHQQPQINMNNMSPKTK